MADLVEAAELAVRAARPGEAFSFDANGFATLAVQGHTWHAGRFETPSIAELLRAALECPGLQAPEVRRIMDGLSAIGLSTDAAARAGVPRATGPPFRACASSDIR